MTTTEGIQLATIASNFGVLIAAVRVVRYISQIEVKVNTMWVVFMRRFGDRGDDKE